MIIVRNEVETTQNDQKIIGANLPWQWLNDFNGCVLNSSIFI